MKKIDKLAINDAARYIEAQKVVDDVRAKCYANPAYGDAVGAAYEKMYATQVSVPVRKAPSGPSLKTIGLLVVGAVILHETGYDEVIWNKVKSFGRQAREKAQEVVDENPEVAQAAENVKEAVVDLKDEVKEKVQEATAKTDYSKEPGASI